MSRTTEQYQALGNACMETQDYKGAVKNYKLGLEMDPNSPVLNCNLAQAYLNLKDFVKASQHAKLTIKHQKNNVKAYYRAAKAAVGKGNPEEVMFWLQQGTKYCDGKDVKELLSLATELGTEFSSNFACSMCITCASEYAVSESESEYETESDEDEIPELCKPTSNKLKNGVKQHSNEEEDEESEDPYSVLENKKKLIDAEIIKKRRILILNRDKLKKLKKEKEEMNKDQCTQKDYDEKQRVLTQKINEVSGIIARDKAKMEEDLTELDDITSKMFALETHAYKHFLGLASSRSKEMKERERRAEEIREQEKKAHEKKVKEIKDLQRKEKEKKDQEAKAQEKREMERKEREKKAAEKKAAEKKAAEKKAQELLLKKDLEKKGQEEIDLKAKAKKEEFVRLKNELQYLMKEGSLALLKGLHRTALDYFKKALDLTNTHMSSEIFGTGDQMEIVVLQFAFSQALLLSDDYTDIVKAIKFLDKMEAEGKHTKFPAILLLLGRAYIRLNRFRNALPHLEKAISFLTRRSTLALYSWPGTSDPIELTKKTYLKDTLKNEIQMCKLYHKPDAFCFYDKCLDNSQHIIPSRDIFYSDPDFAGFVHIFCQEYCNIYFHLSCWKDYKENLSDVRKTSEKDFLGQKCFTPDCQTYSTKDKSSVIVKVVIIGPDGEEKSSCAFTPSDSPSLAKEEQSIEKSPKKKPRKKDDDKNNSTTSKRSRKDSTRSQDGPATFTPYAKSKGSQYKDALAKLAAARENNFGYGAEVPDPHKVKVPAVPSLDKNQEFVYSYFLEIFKEEGYMSVYKLQEHWETSREILPALEPALITHTDLIKFLLDTGGFSVVQDMIGIYLELPNISAIVESKAQAPEPTVYEWVPSPATLVEASKTLSFSHFDCDDTDLNHGNAGDFISGDDHSSGNRSRISFNENVQTQNMVGCMPYKPTENSNGDIVPSLSNGEYSRPSQCHLEEVNNQHADREALLVEDKKKSFTEDSKQEILTNSIPHWREESVSSVPVIEPTAPVILGHDLGTEVKVKCPEDTPSSCQTIQQDEELPKSFERDIVPSTSTNEKIQSGAQTSQKISWKPRAKLLEWATETFPGESKVRLWEALTIVRAHNNYTLSGLSFDIIAERVAFVLQPESSDF